MLQSFALKWWHLLMNENSSAWHSTMFQSIISFDFDYIYRTVHHDVDWLFYLYFFFLCVAALPLVELFGGKEEGIKQLITLMYCFRGDLPNLANIVGKLVSLNMAYSVGKPLWGKSKLWPGERIIKEHGLNDRTWTRRDTTFNYTRGGWA